MKQQHYVLVIAVLVGIIAFQLIFPNRPKDRVKEFYDSHKTVTGPIYLDRNIDQELTDEIRFKYVYLIGTGWVQPIHAYRNGQFSFMVNGNFCKSKLSSISAVSDVPQ